LESLVNIEKLLNDKIDSCNHYTTNELIFKEGDKIEGIYLIKEGQIKVTRKAKNNMTVWFAKSNEFIGLSSYFNELENYSFSTSAFGGDVDAVLIPTNEFKKILENNLVFKQEIIQILCSRIGSTLNRISNVKNQSIKERVLGALFLLIDKGDLNKSTVKIKYSINELSELSGTSKQYIKKLMSEFRRNKLLQVKADNLIVDMVKLNSLVS
jgi:CRP-like cAMP-binding protein